MRLKGWSRPFVILNSSSVFILFLLGCATIGTSGCGRGAGPRVTGCVVDVAALGYDCVTYPDTRSFIAFSNSKDLKCMSPVDLEDVLKACKQGHQHPVTLCAYDQQNVNFLCTDTDGHEFSLALNGADNYFCLNAQDQKRVLERCESPIGERVAGIALRFIHDLYLRSAHSPEL